MSRHVRNLPARLLVALCAVLPACGAAREPTAPASVPAENAAPAPVPTTAPGDTPSPPPVTASSTPDPAPSEPAAIPAPAVTPEPGPPGPAPAPVPAQCRGSAIDLTAALADDACRVSESFAAPAMAPNAVVLSVEPARPRVKRGEQVTLQVVFENRSDAPQSLFFRFTPSPRADLMSDSSDATDGFWIEARTAFSDASLDEPPGHVAMGALVVTSRARVELEPGGRAVGTVSWRAVGFVPGKRYRPRRDAWGTKMWVPEPLPRGSYMLTIHTSLEGPEGRSVIKMVSIEVTR